MAYNFVVSISGLGYFLYQFSKLMVGALDVLFLIGHIGNLNISLNIGCSTLVSGFTCLYITKNRVATS